MEKSSVSAVLNALWKPNKGDQMQEQSKREGIQLQRMLGIQDEKPFCLSPGCEESRQKLTLKKKKSQAFQKILGLVQHSGEKRNSLLFRQSQEPLGTKLLKHGGKRDLKMREKQQHETRPNHQG